MNNKYCFRYIKMILIFVALFAFKTNVKALTHAECYYQDNKFRELYTKGNITHYVENIDFIYYKLIFKGGNPIVRFYNAKTKQESSQLTAIKDKNVADSSDPDSIRIQLPTSTMYLKDITEETIKEKCPDYLVRVQKKANDIAENIYVGTFTDESLPARYYKKEKLKNWTPLQNNNDICKNLIEVGYVDSPASKFCSTASINASMSTHEQYTDETKDPEKIPDDKKNKDIITCNYANENIAMSDFEVKNVHATLSINIIEKKLSLTGIKDISTSSSNLNFSYDDIKGECPKILYNTEYTNDWSVVDNGKGIKYSLINYITLEEDDTSEEGTVLTDGVKKILQTVYTVIRYLVPSLIVVLSTIDFAGVVLSGENDKMEKTKKKFIVRLIVGAIVLFVPIILEMILKMAGIIDNNILDLFF